MTSKIILKFALTFASLILFLILAEFFIRLTDLDIKSTKTNLYYQDENLALYRPSININKIFEMVPNERIFINGRNFEINNFGFRDRIRELDKSDKYRIIIVGDSNTFGQSVKDSETYPYILEEKLNAKYGDEFEVWNTGISAHTLSQKIETAEEIIKKYNPDLLIIQDNNGQRRSFLSNQDVTYYFNNNPEIFRENLPPIFYNKTKFIPIHYYLIDHLASYRFIAANINNVIIASKIKDNDDSKGDSAYLESYLSLKGFNNYSAIRNNRDFDNFLAKNEKQKIIIFDSLDELYCGGGKGITRYGTIKKFQQYANLDYFSLCDYNEKPAEFHDSHPPVRAYEWYADELMKMLEERGYLNQFK